jgi:hypothetical protein
MILLIGVSPRETIEASTVRPVDISPAQTIEASTVQLVLLDLSFPAPWVRHSTSP